MGDGSAVVDPLSGPWRRRPRMHADCRRKRGFWSRLWTRRVRRIEATEYLFYAQCVTRSYCLDYV